jgi:hypothetical protein
MTRERGPADDPGRRSRAAQHRHDGDREPLGQAKKTYPTISKSWVDTGFKNAVVEHGAVLGIDVEVINRNPGVRGFHVVKRRWVAERSLGWIMMRRRLARDYETLPASSEAVIHIASIDNLTKRITDETTPTWRGTY